MDKTIYDLLDEMNNLIEEQIGNMDKVSAEVLGLDRRAGCLWVDDDCVIVSFFDDKMLQYYGGFEYIDESCRNVVGDYVIYTEHDRVLACIEKWESTK